MKLSQLCLLCGLGYALPNIYGLLNPKSFGAWLQKFPRHIPLGCLLMLTATGWFEWILWNERLSDIAPWKHILQLVFLFAGIASCFVLQDFLAVRGISILMMLVANTLLDAQRWHPSALKNVVTFWAYVMAVLAMWFVVSPWRLRDWIHWNTASESRLKTGAAVRAAFGVGIAVLGMTVLK